MNIGVLRSRVRSKGAQALPKFTNFLKFLMPYLKARSFLKNLFYLSTPPAVYILHRAPRQSLYDYLPIDNPLASICRH